MISNYTFGRMQIGETIHTSDLIIYPDKTVRSSWWRKVGHLLLADDIADLLDASPTILVVGTGSLALMRIDNSLVKLLGSRGIFFYAQPTEQAVATCNSLFEQGRKVGACFHLTC